MNNIINEIRKKQDEIILMVNSSFEEIIRRVSELNEQDIMEINDYEMSHPITNTAGFKGKKVIAVSLDERREVAPTWKKAVEKILKEVMKDDEMKKRIYNLRNKLLGRTRTRLSSTSDEMRSPLKLDENLYIETHYDTETLMKLLLQILNEISYDYSKIKIVIKN